MAEKSKDPVKKARKARLLDIEVAKAELDLKQAKGDYALDQLRLAREKRAHIWNENSDLNHGVFRVESYVGGETMDIAAKVQQFSRTHPGKPITIYICSGGGSVFAGWVLYDALRTASSQGHHVTTVLRGMAASMAGVLFMAGDTRLVGSEGFLMIHEISTVAVGKLSELADEVELCKRLNKRVEDIFVSKTAIKRTEFRKKATRTDWWIDPETAVELGIAHDIG